MVVALIIFITLEVFAVATIAFSYVTPPLLVVVVRVRVRVNDGGGGGSTCSSSCDINTTVTSGWSRGGVRSAVDGFEILCVSHIP